MKFKVDENLPREVADLMRIEGYTSETVVEESLGGRPDQEIMAICSGEGYCLLTLDVGFADIRTYPPGQYPGIVVLRLRSQEKQYVLDAISRLIEVLKSETLVNRLWIVEEGRVRIRQ